MPGSTAPWLTRCMHHPQPHCEALPAPGSQRGPAPRGPVSAGGLVLQAGRPAPGRPPLCSNTCASIRRNPWSGLGALRAPMPGPPAQPFPGTASGCSPHPAMAQHVAPHTRVHDSAARAARRLCLQHLHTPTITHYQGRAPTSPVPSRAGPGSHPPGTAPVLTTCARLLRVRCRVPAAGGTQLCASLGATEQKLGDLLHQPYQGAEGWAAGGPWGTGEVGVPGRAAPPAAGCRALPSQRTGTPTLPPTLAGMSTGAGPYQGRPTVGMSPPSPPGAGPAAIPPAAPTPPLRTGPPRPRTSPVPAGTPPARAAEPGINHVSVGHGDALADAVGTCCGAGEQSQPARGEGEQKPAGAGYRMKPLSPEEPGVPEPLTEPCQAVAGPPVRPEVCGEGVCERPCQALGLAYGWERACCAHPARARRQRHPGTLPGTLADRSLCASRSIREDVR